MPASEQKKPRKRKDKTAFGQEDERMANYRLRPTRRSVLVAFGWNMTAIHRGVAEYAIKANWILNDTMCHNGRIPNQWSGDGIITMIIDPDERELVKLTKEKNLPVVNLGSYESPNIRCCVTADNELIGAQAAEHLLNCGFKNYAFLCVNAFPVEKERMNGFRHVVQNAGKDFFELNFVPKTKTDRLEIGRRSKLISDLSLELRKLPLPLAVMAQYDSEANDVVRACLEANLRIPEDVAVIGVDNDPIYSMLGPMPLSSVNNNLRMIGYRAAEALDKILDGVPLDQTIIRIKPEGVTVRESTDIMAIDDVYISNALRYMIGHFREDIRVEDIVKNSGTTRRGLYSRFERRFGRTIYQELVLHRLEYAKQLLRDTDQKLNLIAKACGLGDTERLSKSFKRCWNVSPFEYSAEHREKSKK